MSPMKPIKITKHQLRARSPGNDSWDNSSGDFFNNFWQY